MNEEHDERYNTQPPAEADPVTELAETFAGHLFALDPTKPVNVRYVVPPWIKGEPKIFAAVIEANRLVEAVSKDRVNMEQKFKFRGIDGVYNGIHSALATAGVVPAPRVLSTKKSERKTRNGYMQELVEMDVEYWLTAADGSVMVVGPVPSQALDTSDKAINKALSFAQKYALIQTFTIPTQDDLQQMAEAEQDRDGDARTNERGERVVNNRPAGPKLTGVPNAPPPSDGAPPPEADQQAPASEPHPQERPPPPETEPDAAAGEEPIDRDTVAAVLQSFEQAGYSRQQLEKVYGPIDILPRRFLGELRELLKNPATAIKMLGRRGGA